MPQFSKCTCMPEKTVDYLRLLQILIVLLLSDNQTGSCKSGHETSTKVGLVPRSSVTEGLGMRL